MESKGTSVDSSNTGCLLFRLIGYHEYCPNFQIQDTNTSAKTGCNAVDVSSMQKETEIGFRTHREPEIMFETKVAEVQNSQLEPHSPRKECTL